MEQVQLPPGSTKSRLLQTLGYARDSVGTLDRAHAQYGDIFSMRVLGGENWVFITDPKDIKTLFTAELDVAVSGENMKQYFEPLTGDSTVFVLDGDAHLRRRRLLMPKFQGERMQSYAQRMYTRTIEEMQKWPKGRAFPLVPKLQELSLDIITHAAFGQDEQSALPARIRALANSAFSSPFLFLRWLRFDWGHLSPWGRILKQIKAADALIYAEITARRAKPKDDPSILSLLLASTQEDGTPLSDKHIRDELITMLVAGHETTASSLAWAFERVLSHPEILQKVQAELKDVDIGADPAAVAKLPLLDSVVKEALRVRPLFSATGNRRLKKPITLSGYTIPPGTVVSIPPYIVHRRPEVYADPERFSDERFLNKTPDPYTWLGFGGGTRRCIGMHLAMFEMKIILGIVLQRDALRLESANVPRAYKGITIHPAKGLPVIKQA